MRVSFPYVTRTVTVINRSSTDLRIHFNSLSDSQHVVTHRHYVSLTENRDSITFNVKCKEVFISLANSGSNGDFELVAELTPISVGDMIKLTGSGLTD